MALCRQTGSRLLAQREVNTRLSDGRVQQTCIAAVVNSGSVGTPDSHADVFNSLMTPHFVQPEPVPVAP